MHLVTACVTTHAGFMCVRETAMYICGGSCLCVPVHSIERVCILVGSCAFRGAAKKSRKDARPNLLLREEASEVAVKTEHS